MVVLENCLFLNGIFYAVLGLVGRFFRLEVHQTSHVLPVFKDMHHLSLIHIFQLCDFFQKRFLLLLQLLLGTVLIIWVLGKVGGGFFIPGNLRVFLFCLLYTSRCV